MLKKEKTVGHTPQKTVKWICELQLNFFMIMWQRWHHSFVPFSIPLATPKFISVFPNHLKGVDVSDRILNDSWRCISVTLSIIQTWRAPHFSQKLLASPWSSHKHDSVCFLGWLLFPCSFLLLPHPLLVILWFLQGCLLLLFRSSCNCSTFNKNGNKGSRKQSRSLPSNMSGDGIAQEKKGTSNKRNKPSVKSKSKRKQKRKEEKVRRRERTRGGVVKEIFSLFHC